MEIQYYCQEVHELASTSMNIQHLKGTSETKCDYLNMCYYCGTKDHLTAKVKKEEKEEEEEKK